MMTKEHIISVLLNSGKISDNQLKFDLFTGDIANVADELLTLFKQELLERLEQLYTEMGERMHEEVAIEKQMGEKKAEKLLSQIEELTTGKCALRCPLVEQEKKEQAREIFEKIVNTMPAYNYDELPEAEKNLIRNDDFWYLFNLNNIAKEYMVEL